MGARMPCQPSERVRGIDDFRAADIDRGVVRIPGTTKLRRLEENLGAVNVQLTADDLREIHEAASKIRLQGDRYPSLAAKGRSLAAVRDAVSLRFT
jgi:hypothetical protein